MHSPAHVLIAFAFETLPSVSLARQAEVYRANRGDDSSARGAFALRGSRRGVRRVDRPA